MNDVKHAAYVRRQHDALEGNEIWEGGDGGDDDANGDRCRDDDDARRHDDNDDDDGDHHTSIREVTAPLLLNMLEKKMNIAMRRSEKH